MSIRKRDFPYTCPGLGDRIHSALLGFQYGKKNGFPVRVHITSDKFDKRKPQSWKEIVDLFPQGSIEICPHPVCGLTEEAWTAYLRKEGFNPRTYYYGDTCKMNRFDYRPWIDLDISELLKDYPCLPLRRAFPEFVLPEKYVTLQWDSSGPGSGRKLGKERMRELSRKHQRQGYETIILGGESRNPFLNGNAPLDHLAYVISNANLHVGIDSGLMHLASLYLRPDQIHLYSTRFRSHHFVRAANNGCVIDHFS